MGYLFYVGDAAEGDFHLRIEIVIGAHDSVSEEDDIARAIGALAVLDAGDVGRALGRASDDHDALVGDGVDGAAAFEKGPQGRKNDTRADSAEMASQRVGRR